MFDADVKMSLAKNWIRTLPSSDLPQTTSNKGSLADRLGNTRETAHPHQPLIMNVDQ